MSSSSGEVGPIRISGLSGPVCIHKPSSVSPSPVGNSSTNPNKVEEIYVPQEGTVTVISKDPEKKVEDIVEFKVKDKGFAHAIGFKAAYPAYVGGDVKLVYWNRFGAELGAGYAFERKKMGVDVGVSYRLDRLLPIFNTEVYCGYEPLGKTVLVGFRINL